MLSTILVDGWKPTVHFPGPMKNCLYLDVYYFTLFSPISSCVPSSQHTDILQGSRAGLHPILEVIPVTQNLKPGTVPYKFASYDIMSAEVFLLLE